ncbi:LysR family transcriptional regulator [Vibrio ezurae]|uniref:Putative LysR family transcriptional regulator n=1 Tax=Vibrio ezurae NBRC 102218 TaxID=1219080 RepID=U3CJ10_9VIBR|nr:LysR family transcriptional regulator [Vibrio ezurae]GAD78223.1 putative LysR family transcriptional regulator [Vibrio ezurae NBRC 102218]
MEIKTLKSFVAVATFSSFSRAAKELNTVQPAISRHIAALESELKTQLFFRTSREVSLTASGARLFKDASALILQVEQTKQAVQRASQGQIGTLTIGYLGGAVLSFLPRLVRQYIKSHPNIDVNLVEMTAAEQVEALLDQRIDISLSRPMPEQYAQSYTSFEIYKDKLVAVLSLDHPLAQCASIQLSDIQHEPFILFDRESAIGLFDGIIKECQIAQFSPRIIHHPKQMQTVLTQVASGLGVSVVPSAIQDLRSDECVFVPIDGMRDTLPLVLTYQTHRASPMAKDFAQLIHQHCDEIKRQQK